MPERLATLVADIPDVEQPGYQDVQPLGSLTFQMSNNLDTKIVDDQNAQHPGNSDGAQSERLGIPAPAVRKPTVRNPFGRQRRATIG
jgi:hypothetical protein